MDAFEYDDEPIKPVPLVPPRKAFEAWSCGHDHVRDTSGRVPVCEPRPAWYLTPSPGGMWLGRGSRGVQLRPSDVVLHVLDASTGTYHPARWHADVVPVEAAAWARAHKRRLLVSQRTYYRLAPH